MKFNVREEAFRISGVDLTQIDGINESAALGLISEIGINMSPWPTEKHFASWLTLCPNNKISGGHVLKRRTRKSANRARETFCASAPRLYSEAAARLALIAAVSVPGSENRKDSLQPHIKWRCSFIEC
jgi:transposase